MATNWAVFLETGFSISLNHDNEPSDQELKEEFLRQVGSYLKGEIEFNFKVNDPQPIDISMKITDQKGEEITNG